MGILLQALVLLIFVGAGTAALINNFTQQKMNHLSKLEILDRDQFTNTLRKILGNNNQCVESLRNLSLPPTPTSSPITITNVDFRYPGTGSPGVVLFAPNTAVGFQRINNLDLDIIECTGTDCTIGATVNTHRATLRWSLNSVGGTRRSLQGTIGPIFFTRNVTTSAPENCAFAVSGVASAPVSQAQAICEGILGQSSGANRCQFNSFTNECDCSPVFAEAFLGSPPTTANPIQEIITQGSRNIATAFNTQGGQEGSALTSIPPSLAVTFTASSFCGAAAGTARRKWVSGTTSFVGSINQTNLLPHSCSPLESPYALFRRQKLIKRGCSSNPDIFNPSTFSVPVGNISETLDCITGN